MLRDDFDQTRDTVYEVWNYSMDTDPLVGVFDDEGRADDFEFEQTIETGGGIVVYYPPIERYTDQSPESRARTLLSEAIIRLICVNGRLESGLSPEPLLMLDSGLPDPDVDLSYDRDTFDTIIEEVAWNEMARELMRVSRTLARVRHLSVYDRSLLLSMELDIRDKTQEINEMPE